MTSPHGPDSWPIERCQICDGTSLAPVLFIGYVPPVNTMPSLGTPLEEQPAYPLQLLRCNSCGLVQIGLAVSEQILFPHSYPYLSATTRILRENFADLYREVDTMLGLDRESLVVDNYTGLDAGILDCVLEVSTSHKLDRLIPGTTVPVLDEAKLFADQPEYALLLSWHIASELIENLTRKGYSGRFIVPLPRPEILPRARSTEG